MAGGDGDELPALAQIIPGVLAGQHIHMLVVAPPQLAPAKLVGFLKGRSSRMLQRDFPHLRSATGASISGRADTSVRP